jgi:hypothetical protein
MTRRSCCCSLARAATLLDVGLVTRAKNDLTVWRACCRKSSVQQVNPRARESAERDLDPPMDDERDLFGPPMEQNEGSIRISQRAIPIPNS